MAWGWRQRLTGLFLIFFGVAALVAGALYYFYGNPEGRIRTTILRAALAFQDKELGVVLSAISPTYKDPYGYTYADLHRFLVNWCRDRDSNIWMTLSFRRVELLTFWDADAIVETQGIALPFSVAGFRFGPVTVTVSLERDWLGRWRIISIYGWRQDEGLARLEGELTGQP